MFELSTYARRIFGACIFASSLIGCSQAESPDGGFGPIPQATAIASHSQAHRSWILPEAKSEDLLYLSSGDVSVYSYPRGELVGALRGLRSTGGACSDTRGDVWIIENGTTLLEYAHGGKRPIYALGVPVGMSASDCAVDPVSGNLAVIGGTYASASKKPGAIAIYADASGTPALYRWKYYATFGTYDNMGNLFIDGFGYSVLFAAAELHKGAKRLKLISFGSQTYSLCYYLSPLRWDGKHVVFGCSDEYSAWTVLDNTATPEGTGVFNDAYRLNDFWFEGKTVVVSSSEASGSIAPIQIYKYPAAGNPIRVISSRSAESGAVTVSAASH
jgi:hypothetical protein